jgi:putative SOS response-associated peptidase YedK
MCGRYTQRKKIDELALLFDFDPGELLVEPRYNMAPGQLGLVVVSEEHKRKAQLMKWGLVPNWADDPKMGYRMINARAESIDEKPAYKNLIKKTRCLVLADGFYEWPSKGKSSRPYRFTLENEKPFAMAGLWTVWQKEGLDRLFSYTIITTKANKTVSRYHERMPVILDNLALEVWIDPQVKDQQTLKMVLTGQNPILNVTEASSLVNSAKNEGPELLIPDKDTLF